MSMEGLSEVERRKAEREVLQLTIEDLTRQRKLDELEAARQEEIENTDKKVEKGLAAVVLTRQIYLGF